MNKFCKCLSIVSVCSLLYGCNSEVNFIEVEGFHPNGAIVNFNNDENIVYNDFNFLDYNYKKNEDISKLENGTVIFDSKENEQYNKGKYVQADFAVDLITEYLKGNEQIYDYTYSEVDLDNTVILLSNEEKSRLKESNEYLKTQMTIASDEPIYFKLDKVIYNGEINENVNEVSFEVRGYISPYSDYFVSISSYTVNVVIEKNKIYGNIQ